MKIWRGAVDNQGFAGDGPSVASPQGWDEFQPQRTDAATLLTKSIALIPICAAYSLFGVSLILGRNISIFGRIVSILRRKIRKCEMDGGPHSHGFPVNLTGRVVGFEERQ